MIGVKARTTLFFAVVLGIAALCVLAVHHQSPEPREKIRQRNFDRTVAEGMRLWNPKAGVDSVRFDACRIEKMRMGAFRLGAFNVLCLEGLVLNLPLPEEDGIWDQGSGSGEAVSRPLQCRRDICEVVAAVVPPAGRGAGQKLLGHPHQGACRQPCRRPARGARFRGGPCGLRGVHLPCLRPGRDAVELRGSAFLLIDENVQNLLDLPYWTARVDLVVFREFAFKSQERKDFPIGKHIDISLRSIFEGKVSVEKGTFPEFYSR